MDEYISREAVLNLIEHNDKVCHYKDERYENVVYATTQTICKVVAEMPAADVQSVNQWISVEDRLPNHYEEVLVVSKLENIVYFAWYDADISMFMGIVICGQQGK